MPSAAGQYDEALLAAAPAATKAQLQEGYATDLLHPSHGNATPPLLASQADVERGLVHKEYNGAHATRAVPFWRTRKGIIIIFIAAIVILAAIIGGAVGGSKKHASPTSDESQGQGHPSGTSSTPSGGDIGATGNSEGQGQPSATSGTPSETAIGAPTTRSIPTTTAPTTTTTPPPSSESIGAASPTTSSSTSSTTNQNDGILVGFVHV